MSKRVNFTLSEDEQVKLEQAITSSAHPEVRQRAIALRMLHMGQKPEQVADSVMVTPATIYAWHKRWRELGIEGIRDRSRSGRPSKADAAYIQQLHQL